MLFYCRCHFWSPARWRLRRMWRHLFYSECFPLRWVSVDSPSPPLGFWICSKVTWRSWVDVLAGRSCRSGECVGLLHFSGAAGGFHAHRTQSWAVSSFPLLSNSSLPIWGFGLFFYRKPIWELVLRGCFALHHILTSKKLNFCKEEAKKVLLKTNSKFRKPDVLPWYR